jgi:GST-like protein
MIELFGDTTGNCVRAAIALEESGLPHRLCKVDLARGEHRDPAYLDLNPLGRVPALIDSEGPGSKRFVLTQSNAILLYLAEKSGRLLPADGAQRAAALEWLFLFVTDVIAPQHQLFHVRQVLGAALASSVIATLNARSLAHYDHFDERLGSRDYVVGTTLTVADIAAYTITAALTEHLHWQRLPNVQRWFAAMAGRRAFQRGVMAFREASEHTAAR